MRSMKVVCALLLCASISSWPAQAQPSLGSPQGGFVSGDGWGQVLWYNYTTAASQSFPPKPAPFDFDYALPANTWVGLFLYDYELAQFAWGMYSYREPLP